MRNLYVYAGSVLMLIGAAALAVPPKAKDWTIGPIIRGKNYSVGMPLGPTSTRNGWAFDFPAPSRAAGHVHYVTFDPVSLKGKSEIVVRYRVDAAKNTRFVPQEHPHLPGTVSLFLQRRGDTWNARGKYNFYRWYAPLHSVRQISPGVHQLVVRLDDPAWVAVMHGSAGKHPEAFAATLADPGAIGLVFGSIEARGHGVFATRPARFEMLSFKIE